MPTDYNKNGTMYVESMLIGPNNDWAIVFGTDSTLKFVRSPFGSSPIEAVNFSSGGSAAATLNSIHSLQAVSGDLTLSGTGLGHAGGYAAGVMGNVLSAAGVTSVTNGNTTAGVVGKYTLSATKAGYTPGYPRAGVVAELAGYGDAPFVAVVTDGDNNAITATSMYGVDWQAGAGSSYNFSLDLKGTAHDVYGAIPLPNTADIQFAAGPCLVMLNTAITANVTTTTLPAGSVGFTSHATGNTRTFKSDGSKWQVTA